MLGPALNQVELHPRFQQSDLRRKHAELGIVTEGPGQPVAALSGGNQPKVVVSRPPASRPVGGTPGRSIQLAPRGAGGGWRGQISFRA